MRLGLQTGDQEGGVATERESPIIFDTESIPALQHGLIRVTFRAIRPQPDRLNPRTGRPEIRLNAPGNIYQPIAFPWGGVGTRLWVREAGYQARYTAGWKYLDEIAPGAEPDDAEWRRVSPIHAPRDRSRLELVLQEYSAMRLHDITDDDALLAGITPKMVADLKRQLGARTVRHDHRGAIIGEGGRLSLASEIWPEGVPRKLRPCDAFAYYWHLQNRRKNKGWDRNLYVWRLRFAPV